MVKHITPESSLMVKDTSISSSLFRTGVVKRWFKLWVFNYSSCSRKCYNSKCCCSWAMSCTI